MFSVWESEFVPWTPHEKGTKQTETPPTGHDGGGAERKWAAQIGSYNLMRTHYWFPDIHNADINIYCFGVSSYHWAGEN